MSTYAIQLSGDCLTRNGKCGNMDATQPKWKLIQERIQGEHVLVFSKSYCPYCQQVKALLDSEGVPYTVVELDTHKNGAEYQRILLQLTGQRTVPNVFINGRHIGGASDTMDAYQNGTLSTLLGKE